MTLSDDVIAQLVKLLQLAILTGTDISDNLRTLRLVSDGDKLELDLTIWRTSRRTSQECRTKLGRLVNELQG